MFAGIERNAQAMDVLTQKQDIVSNNLANAATPGFKKDSVAIKSFQETLQAAVYTDRMDGLLKQTGNPLDLALEGAGFFAIQTPEGVQYTREGSFRLNSQGEVVTAEGYALLSDGGVLRLDPQDKGDLKIAEDGRVTVGTTVKGTVNVVSFPENAVLEKLGHNRVSLTSGTPQPSKARVMQGTLENSTVQSVEMMVEMMDTLKHFEANQRSIRMQDDALGKAIATLGQ